MGANLERLKQYAGVGGWGGWGGDGEGNPRLTLLWWWRDIGGGRCSDQGGERDRRKWANNVERYRFIGGGEI